MTFITEDFLLQNDAAKELYHGYAQDLPIIDYHCHLSPEDIATNRTFANLFEIWLEGDHYKWRTMRTNGIDERYCTGDAEPKEKFLAFAKTLPDCLRNPMYHWCHLELKRYFGIEKTLGPDTAEEIWSEANTKLADGPMTAHKILEKFKVSVVCTTDDPVDSLEHHEKIASSNIATRVYPTFRPDKAIALNDVAIWNQWVDKLSAVSNLDCSNLAGLRDALKNRHDFFHSVGGRLSDHGLERCYADFPTEAEATAIFDKARSGKAVTPEEIKQFASHLMEFFGELDAEKGWVKQLHLGAMRNVNDQLYNALGPDIGCDSIGDFDQGSTLGRYLGRLAGKSILPKTILYNLNPRDNYLFATMIGNFQRGSVPGKMQLGSGWWFLDQKEGMTWQINALSNLGLLGHFVGMLTDSRSFMSYCRHEYFRRLICQIIGEDVEKGELPNDMTLLGTLVDKICYTNASHYFGFELGDYVK
ncbi:glucuronate isomerase [Puniceicoccales bacterium CK1056]|uniref:Uronate isomerase n=1 Tax=Oceanipulchritudo coccoides TaxID=2706888 RepID=A0A6B2M181_9BACT|nr:glucuronate isomerase [Oceanipulchritudo coccoides]NDV62126.1 glucuronate isomerase [Oceanipulchritudo coccoides]